MEKTKTKTPKWQQEFATECEKLGMQAERTEGPRGMGYVVKPMKPESGAQIAPIVYEDELPDAIAEAVSLALQAKEFAELQVKEFAELLTDPESVRAMVMPRAWPACDLQTVKRHGYPYIEKCGLVFTLEVTHRGKLTQINRNILDSLGLTFTEVCEAAKANIESRVKVVGLSDFVAFGVHDINFGKPDPDMPNVVAPMVFHGAGVLMFDALLDKVAEALEAEELYILPSSIHEIIAVNAERFPGTPKDLAEMVRCVNATELSEGEFLSNSVYGYTKTRGLTILA